MAGWRAWVGKSTGLKQIMRGQEAGMLATGHVVRSIIQDTRALLVRATRRVYPSWVEGWGEQQMAGSVGEGQHTITSQGEGVDFPAVECLFLPEILKGEGVVRTTREGWNQPMIQMMATDMCLWRSRRVWKINHHWSGHSSPITTLHFTHNLRRIWLKLKKFFWLLIPRTRQDGNNYISSNRGTHYKGGGHLEIRQTWHLS